MFLGGMKAAFVPSHSPGPWPARRLDSADVDVMWTLVFGWPQLGLISPLQFPSLSWYIGVELKRQQCQQQQTCNNPNFKK